MNDSSKRDPKPVSTAVPPKLADQPAPTPPGKQNLLHGMLSYPGFGPLFATFLGLILPFILYCLIIPVPKEYVMVGLGLMITVWNLLLIRLLKVKITLPIIPIPLWIAGILITGYACYEVISGTA